MTSVGSHGRFQGIRCLPLGGSGCEPLGVWLRLCFRFPRRPRSCSSTASRTPARTPCWLVFRLAATPSGSPGPVLYSEDGEYRYPVHPGAKALSQSSQRLWGTEVRISANLGGIKIKTSKMHTFPRGAALVCSDPACSIHLIRRVSALFGAKS